MVEVLDWLDELPGRGRGRVAGERGEEGKKIERVGVVEADETSAEGVVGARTGVEGRSEGEGLGKCDIGRRSEEEGGEEEEGRGGEGEVACRPRRSLY